LRDPDGAFIKNNSLVKSIVDIGLLDLALGFLMLLIPSAFFLFDKFGRSWMLCIKK
jgi:hypothetical protein